MTITIKPGTRNGKLLASFVKYCKKYPDLRFWQALRNWSEYSAVMVVDSHWKNQGKVDVAKMFDTFYFEGRNG